MHTVAFCMDDHEPYLMLFRVAVRSLRHVQGNGVRIVCLYAGDDSARMDGVRAEGVELVRYQPVLSRQLIPERLQYAIGCFLKLELALVPELADCAGVLYCDCDVMFMQSIDALLAMQPPYMAMAREMSLPFFHDHEQLDYTWRDHTYVVPLPFPIWTYSSGVMLCNLERLRRHDYIHNFLAFCVQNVHCIGNLDQSLLNYFFGKRITKLGGEWNCPPYLHGALERARIVHFHGPKPWDVRRAMFADLRINDYEPARAQWGTWLTPAERAQVAEWEASN